MLLPNRETGHPPTFSLLLELVEDLECHGHALGARAMRLAHAAHEADLLHGREQLLARGERAADRD